MVACVEVTILIQKVHDLNLCPDDRLSSTEFARFPSEYATTASFPHPLEIVFTTHPTIGRYIIQATKIVVLNRQSITRTHYRL